MKWKSSSYKNEKRWDKKFIYYNIGKIKMISEEISYSELYNYRKDLVNWRYRGPINTI